MNALSAIQNVQRYEFIIQNMIVLSHCVIFMSKIDKAMEPPLSFVMGASCASRNSMPYSSEWQKGVSAVVCPGMELQLIEY